MSKGDGHVTKNVLQQQQTPDLELDDVGCIYE